MIVSGEAEENAQKGTPIVVVMGDAYRPVTYANESGTATQAALTRARRVVNQRAPARAGLVVVVVAPTMRGV